MVFKQRINGYAAADSKKLNDDQKQVIKSLPTLEAIQKELGEVKKAIEVDVVTVHQRSVFL